jgi:hypothetical protein
MLVINIIKDDQLAGGLNQFKQPTMQMLLKQD